MVTLPQHEWSIKERSVNTRLDSIANSGAKPGNGYNQSLTAFPRKKKIGEPSTFVAGSKFLNGTHLGQKVTPSKIDPLFSLQTLSQIAIVPTYEMIHVGCE
jgi:hypothetical protein